VEDNGEGQRGEAVGVLEQVGGARIAEEVWHRTQTTLRSNDSMLLWGPGA